MPDGDIAIYAMDGNGAGNPAVLETVFAPRKPGEFVWLHLHRDHENTRKLLQDCGLDNFICDALLADETRPRCTVHGDGAIVNLRGVNLNPGAEPEDMVSLRLWLGAGLVIGVWRRQLAGVSDIVHAIERGMAPVSPGDFVAKMALRLSDRAEPTVAALNEQIDDLEVQVIEPGRLVSRPSLSAVRRSAIILRRFMLPQRDALTTLEIEDLTWLSDRDRSRLREAAERIQRLGEDLDTIRDRAQVVHDQIMDRRSERMSQRMLVLSVVTAMFLPLSLLTGLLGTNVGGIPFAKSPYGFAAVCGLLLALGAGLLFWFRRKGIFR